MDIGEFRSLITREFLQLREEWEYWEDDLPHLQMGDFLNFTQEDFTQEAIEARSFDVVRESFEIAKTDLKSGDAALLTRFTCRSLSTQHRFPSGLFVGVF